MIEWILPLEIQSPNIKEHWSETSSRNKRNLVLIKQAFSEENEKPEAPCSVSLQRLYNPSIHQKRMDDDRYIISVAGIRDAIADLIIPGLAPGQADNINRGIKFEYDQLTCRLQRKIGYHTKRKKVFAVKLTHIRIIIITQEEIEDHLNE
jgi:hypothetical protein